MRRAAARAVYPAGMRKNITSLAVLAAVAIGGTVAAGCGSEDAGFDIDKAAAATAEKKTARVTSKVSVEGAGLPLPIELDAKGTTSLTSAEGKLILDLEPLLGLAGAPAGTPGDLEVRFQPDGTLYAKPPKLDQLKIPGGKQWVSLELPALGQALGLPTEGLGKVFTLEPAAQLRALKAAKGLKEVGKEDVGGAETTHYRGTFKFSDFVATLPEAERASAEAAVEKLKQLDRTSAASLDEPVPAELWVDKDGVTRKLLSTSKLPAQGGQPAGTLKQSYVLSDFGVALDAAPPAAGDTFAATEVAAGALEQVAAAQGGTTGP